jgi:sarcosine oxidase subunit beta
LGANSPYDHFPAFAEHQYPYQVYAPSACRGVVSYFPKMAELKVIRNWAGVIDLCMDEVPVFGPVEDVEGFFVASGYSGHGFCLGPVSGKVLSELVSGENPCADWTPLRYNRFKSYQ